MARLSALLLLSLLAVGTAHGQKKLNLYFHAGPAMPMGPNQFVDFWGTGFEVGAGVGFTLAGHFEAVLAVQAQQFPFENDEFLSEADIIGVDLVTTGGGISLSSVHAQLKLNLQESRWFAPYLIGGLGMYWKTFEKTLFTLGGDEVARLARERTTSPGFMLGAGLALIISPRFRVFVEPGYHFLPVRLIRSTLPGSLADRRSTRYLPFRIGAVVLLR